MGQTFPKTKIPFKPIPQPESMVELHTVRFSVLTPRLIRLEYNPTGKFEDRPSQIFWYRQQNIPNYNSRVYENKIQIETDYLSLNYQINEVGFTPENLTIHIKSVNTVWHFGDQDDLNLLGTARTLDQASGSVPLEPGLLSRSGWSVIDDSKTLVFNQAGWLEPRHAPINAIDLYFFGFGMDYQACLDDYAKIAGKVPLLPRWALGNWWSRYWAYTQEELTNLILEFEDRQVPLSVCVIDMDWHITNTGNQCSGWTGYTWNNHLFPDPEGFIHFLHNSGLKAALNLHPAEGVHPHEAVYQQCAEWMGIDPKSEQPIPFDIADPRFAQAYFELLHHPHEARGVDFWWIDWQQGVNSRIPGLDPLWWLNHLHFYDLGRDGNKRPIIFSRWGSLGNHRYPIGFSGDSVVEWDSLAFQPYFTSTASNMAYGWWSHDIGGHMGGIEDPELYTRWVQFGVFSPILRLHSTNNPFHERLPWKYDAEVFRITRKAFQLRHQLIPYIYTMSWRNHTENISLIQPMYHRYPQREEAYFCPQQYLFGIDLIVSPYAEPADPTTGLSRQVIWLPEGDWRHFYTSEYFQGNAWYSLYGTLDDIPVFAKAGTIIPLASPQGWGGIDNPEELEVHIFAGADHTFELYEDDGKSNAYLEDDYATTKFEQSWQRDFLEFKIHPVSGQQRHVPERRNFKLFIHGITQPMEIIMRINQADKAIATEYDSNAETLVLDEIELSRNESLLLKLSSHDDSLISRRDRSYERFFRQLKNFRLNSSLKQMIFDKYDQILDDPDILNRFNYYMEEPQVRVLLETLYQVGIHHIIFREEKFVILWNNHNLSGFSYRTRILAEGNWPTKTRTAIDHGKVPSFKVIIPERIAGNIKHPNIPLVQVSWDVSANYFDLLRIRLMSGSEDNSKL